MNVLVGTMNAHTPNAVRYSREAEELGADGLMIMPPYYYTPTEDEIFDLLRRDLAKRCRSRSCSTTTRSPPTSTCRRSLVARMTKAFDNVRYIKEASMDVARVYDIVEATGGVMNVFAGERIVESFMLGAVGYVNPYGNYIPHASSRIWDFLEQGRIEDAKAIQRMITRIDHIIAEGHPTYGHQCYSKALAAAAGYPVGDVRPPLTRFAELGRGRRQRQAPHHARLDALMTDIEAAACQRHGRNAAPKRKQPHPRCSSRSRSAA